MGYLAIISKINFRQMELPDSGVFVRSSLIVGEINNQGREERADREFREKLVKKEIRVESIGV